MKKWRIAKLPRRIRYGVEYVRYLAQQAIALPVKITLFLLFACCVLALIAVGMMAVCAPICAVCMCFGTTSWDAAFLMLGLIGGFLVLLTTSAGLHRAVDYAVMQPEGTFLHPVPPLRDAIFADTDVLVRASEPESSSLLHPVTTRLPEARPELLLRASNARSPE